MLKQNKYNYSNFFEPELRGEKTQITHSAFTQHILNRSSIRTYRFTDRVRRFYTRLKGSIPPASICPLFCLPAAPASLEVRAVRTHVQVSHSERGRGRTGSKIGQGLTLMAC